ncbi:MAG: hypothetical protein HZB36_07315 [Candidatus Omnitrophica bacterium]|nr:hypothetical protein [Candidatus Omnitrophota bacterium]
MIDLRARCGKQGLFIIFVAALAVVIYIIARVASENDESRIRKVVYAGALGVEREDAAKCASLISDSYLDKYGNNKLSFLKLVSELFREYQDFKVDIKQLNVDIKDADAFVDIGFRCYFKKALEAKVYYDDGKLKLNLKKDSGRWKIESVEYLGSNEVLFLQSVA